MSGAVSNSNSDLSFVLPSSPSLPSFLPFRRPHQYGFSLPLIFSFLSNETFHSVCCVTKHFVWYHSIADPQSFPALFCAVSLLQMSDVHSSGNLFYIPFPPSQHHSFRYPEDKMYNFKGTEHKSNLDETQSKIESQSELSNSITSSIPLHFLSKMKKFIVTSDQYSSYIDADKGKENTSNANANIHGQLAYPSFSPLSPSYSVLSFLLPYFSSCLSLSQIEIKFILYSIESEMSKWKETINHMIHIVGKFQTERSDQKDDSLNPLVLILSITADARALSHLSTSDISLWENQCDSFGMTLCVQMDLHNGEWKSLQSQWASASYIHSLSMSESSFPILSIPSLSNIESITPNVTVSSPSLIFSNLHSLSLTFTRDQYFPLSSFLPPCCPSLHTLQMVISFVNMEDVGATIHHMKNTLRRVELSGDFLPNLEIYLDMMTKALTDDTYRKMENFTISMTLSHQTNVCVLEYFCAHYATLSPSIDSLLRKFPNQQFLQINDLSFLPLFTSNDFIFPHVKYLPCALDVTQIMNHTWHLPFVVKHFAALISRCPSLSKISWNFSFKNIFNNNLRKGNRKTEYKVDNQSDISEYTVKQNQQFLFCDSHTIIWEKIFLSKRISVIRISPYYSEGMNHDVMQRNVIANLPSLPLLNQFNVENLHVKWNGGLFEQLAKHMNHHSHAHIETLILRNIHMENMMNEVSSPLSAISRFLEGLPTLTHLELSFTQIPKHRIAHINISLSPSPLGILFDSMRQMRDLNKLQIKVSTQLMETMDRNTIKVLGENHRFLKHLSFTLMGSPSSIPSLLTPFLLVMDPSLSRDILPHLVHFDLVFPKEFDIHEDTHAFCGSIYSEPFSCPHHDLVQDALRMLLERYKGRNRKLTMYLRKHLEIHAQREMKGKVRNLAK